MESEAPGEAGPASSARGDGQQRVVERSFAAHPGTARTARRFVAEVLEQAGLSDLATDAEIVTGEVATNALLHAGTEVRVLVATARRGARVEVEDGSVVAPSSRPYEAEAVTGHGTAILEALTTRHGAVVGAAGKAVWFDLGDYARPAPHESSSGSHESSSGRQERVRVWFLNFPPRLFLAATAHADALVREAALLAAASALPGGMRTNWHPSPIDCSELYEAAAAAIAEGRTTIDVSVLMPRSAGPAAIARLALIAEADALAGAGQLLLAPSLPEVTAFRKWGLGQIALQTRGLRPHRWRLPSPARLDLAPMEDGELAVMPGTLVVDRLGFIARADEQVGALLGWEDARELVGQRVTVLVTEPYRQALLAELTNYSFTGKTEWADRDFEWMARRRDGTTVPVTWSIRLRGTDRGDVITVTLAAAS